MHVQYYTQWEAIAITQLVWFTGLLIASVILYFDIKKRISSFNAVRSFYVAYIFTMLAKIVGSILTIAVLKLEDFNVGIFATAYSFNLVTVGITIRCLFIFVEYFYRKDPKVQVEEEEKRFFKFRPFLTLALILIIAIVISLVGAILKSSGNPSSASRLLSKAGALLFLITLVAILLALLHIRRVNQDSHRLLLPILAVIVILLARVAYSILVAFEISDFLSISKYLFLFGKWEYYAFLVLIPDGLACLGLLWILFLYVRWYNV